MTYPVEETILQFGGGRFLRGFADLFVHQANAEGQRVGRIVVVQSTESERARLLNAQLGRYHVLVRGLRDGKTVDDVEESASISRALVAQTEWDAVLHIARSPHLKWILSNTTEAGYALNADDSPESASPSSFPAGLFLLLKARFDAGLPGVTIAPCELIEGNGERLREIVRDLAAKWDMPNDFTAWLEGACEWRCTLVDRIVTAGPTDHPLAESDRLLIAAEPFAFWAISTSSGQRPLLAHPAVHHVPDVAPFFLRKVRILNAAHTAIVRKAQRKGIAIVRDAVNDPEIRAYLERLLTDEVLPTLEGRVEEPEEFARTTLERFANPFLEHKIADIALYHDRKIQVRLVSTRDEFVAMFGRTPPLLEEAIGDA